MSAAWSWVLGGTPPTGVERRELTAATGRIVTWRLDAPCTAQFAIDGRSDEAAEIAEFATDLTIYRDGVKVFRGRICPEADDISTDEHRCEFTAIDYRGMLAHRFIDTDHGTWEDVDQGVIAFELIDVTQARPGGDWGITDGIGATSGTLRDRTDYDIGKPVGEALAELGRVDDGFEWEIDADLALNRWYPTRGTDNGLELDYGGIVAKVRRDLSPADFGNAIVATGAPGLLPFNTATVDVGTDERGRWERSFALPTVTSQDTLDARGAWYLAQAGLIRPKWRITLTADRWEGFAQLGLGDTVLWSCQSGRINVNAPHRNVEMMASVGDDGQETIMCGLVKS